MTASAMLVGRAPVARVDCKRVGRDHPVSPAPLAVERIVLNEKLLGAKELGN
jgi:hypothetical protein